MAREAGMGLVRWTCGHPSVAVWPWVCLSGPLLRTQPYCISSLPHAWLLGISSDDRCTRRLAPPTVGLPQPPAQESRDKVRPKKCFLE